MSNEQVMLGEALPDTQNKGDVAAIWLRPDHDNLESLILEAVKHAERYGYDQFDYSSLADIGEPGKGIGDRDEEAIGLWFDEPLPDASELPHLVGKIRSGEVTSHVFTPRLETFSSSWRDVHEVVDSITEHGVTVVAYEDDVVITSEDDAAIDTLKAVADRDRRHATGTIERQLTIWEHNGGRPPIGFLGDGTGGIKPADDFDELRALLRQVKQDEMSAYEASKRSGYSRSAIGDAVEKRPDLYNL